MMKFNDYDVEKYKNCDVFHNICELQSKGFSKDISRKDIFNIAISNRCPIIVKDETGKWFLKGIDRREEFLRDKIFKSNPEKRRGYVLYFIPELCEQPPSSIKMDEVSTKRTLLIEQRQEHWDFKIAVKKNEGVKKRLFEAIMYGRRS
jgi:hypothetical protein